MNGLGLLITVVGVGSAFFLGVALGGRNVTETLLGILEREGVDPRDLPDDLRRRVRHRHPKPSTGA